MNFQDRNGTQPPANADRTEMLVAVPDDVTLPKRNELIARLLDTVNELNISAGGSELEIGEIRDDHVQGCAVKRVSLHGDIQHPSLRMPNLDEPGK